MKKEGGKLPTCKQLASESPRRIAEENYVDLGQV